MTTARRRLPKPRRPNQTKRKPRQQTVAVRLTISLTAADLQAWLACHAAGSRAELLKLLREDIKAAAWQEFAGRDPTEFGQVVAAAEVQIFSGG